MWMDGGPGQKAKAEEVKREVRRAAARRRGTQSMDEEDNLPSDAEMELTELPSRQKEPVSSPGNTRSDGGINTPHDSIESTPGWSGLDTPFADTSAEQELDRRFVTFYFDHFFPFLFPFYRPALLDGGRTWVMELTVRNKAMWHTTLCLSAYFVSVALDNTVSGHEFCKTVAWDKLLRQTDVTFKMLQRDLQQITSSGTQDLAVETARIMGGVIQLQRFEVGVGNFENCQTHLNAAVVLFRQILCNTGNGPRSFQDTLNHMGTAPWSNAWSSDQAAFRFFSALLFVDDIIASTCTEEPPRLLDYHSGLLAKEGSFDTRALDLEEFVGCENWVMLHIGQISALDAWKKSLRKAGQLDMMDLVARAMEIKQALLDNLARLDTAAHSPRTPNSMDTFTLYNGQVPPIPGGGSAFVTRIWAHAALLYLSTVVSGWQPGSPGVRENAARVLELLRQMPAPALLRTVVWPFCMAGCLAQPSEEGILRAMVEALVPLRLFGAARKALEIMENVWQRRDTVGADTWDFAACVGTLGYVPLLV